MASCGSARSAAYLTLMALKANAEGSWTGLNSRSRLRLEAVERLVQNSLGRLPGFRSNASQRLVLPFRYSRLWHAAPSNKDSPITSIASVSITGSSTAAVT
jgi:hypothetical protein